MSRLAMAALIGYLATVLLFYGLYRATGDMGRFTEGRLLFFSLVTQATVGYGDIVPASRIGRSLAAIQVVTGTMLLIFGVSEILEYSRERRKRSVDGP